MEKQFLDFLAEINTIVKAIFYNALNTIRNSHSENQTQS
jgi:hypothetical protein